MRYLFALGTVVLLVATSLAVPDHTHARTHHLNRYSVIIVLDGSRPKYFNLVKMPHLRWLMRRGVTYKNAFVGQEIANTPPGHATIGTGLFPKHHGVEGFMWTDPSTGQMTRPTDLDKVEGGDLEKVLAAHHVDSIASVVHAADPRAKVASVAGHKCYAADAMGTGAADYILCSLIYHDRWVAQAMGNHRPPPGAINNPHFDHPIPPPNSGFAPAVEQWQLGAENDWTMRYALWAFHRIHYPHVLMMNLAETDVAMHFAGNNMKIAAVLMRHFDRELGQLIDAYRKAGIFKRTTFVITADHGMSPVQHRISFGTVKRAIVTAGASTVYLEADTAASIGLTQPSLAKQVALNIARLGGTLIDATYYKVHARGRWFYRPAYLKPLLSPELRRTYLTLMDTAAARSGPDVLAVYAPHTTTGDRMARGYHWLAGHLGPQWDDQHIPLVIAGPGVRHGSVSSYPARLVDIAPTVEHLMGLRPGWTDGHVLQDLLVHPDKKLLRKQEARARWLLPMVHAMEERSGYR
ncbi:MAG: alkaline phosphatase family protein [Chloroflexota bacterium]